RSYLRTMLQASGDDIEGAFRRVNLELARDVRRGMYVTAMYVLVDPSASRAKVLCAGHKIPILRYVAEDKKLSLLQPEGIALGFDKGPVFDRSLAAEEIDFNLGDRLVLANTGPVLVQNEDGEELGEKAFYKIVARYAAKDSMTVLKGVRKELEAFAGEEPFPADISVVTLAREDSV
ncbi:MAG: PP2C family protein-serine/threonine phosphatase, partial [Planctomycetota bacterium]